MKMKIILAVIAISIVGIVISVFIFKKSEEKSFIGYWKSGYEYKITKASDGYYEIFRVADSTPDRVDYFVYDDKKKSLLVHSAFDGGKMEDKKKIFSEKNEELYYDDVEYEYWVYDKDKDQIVKYDKSDYDKGSINGTLDLQEKKYLTRVEGK